jgi:hypothetical protein
MAIDKGNARLALERIEEDLNNRLDDLAKRVTVDKDVLVTNFKIRDYLIEAMKY